MLFIAGLRDWLDQVSARLQDTGQRPAWSIVLALAVLSIFFYVYRLALPRLIPGIPYNAAAARNVLGDVPEMLSHMRQSRGDFVTWISETVKRLDSPLVQVFVRPLSLNGNRPMLILADARETHDILLRRSREFDRSPSMGDLALGIAPSHHIHLRTDDAQFKSQRRLVQDLMTTGFLRDIAGPIIHRSTEVLIELWRVKCRAAEGRPFEASADLSLAVLDAITSFAFGDSFRTEHSATRPALEALQELSQGGGNERKGTMPVQTPNDDGKPFLFPRGNLDEVLQAILDLRETVGDLQGNPLPRLTWAYVMRKPHIRRAWKVKEECFCSELRSAVDHMYSDSSESGVRSAVDHMVRREKELAEKQQRAPEYQSRILLDEIFGFIFAGHDTTSTTLSWTVKFLADHQEVQDKLRLVMQSSFGASGPSFDAINRPMPYVDAVLEEVLRCAPTSPVVDRIATVDTEILGHRVSKGTVVTFLTIGPSILSPPFPIDDSCRGSTTRGRSTKDKAWGTEEMAEFKPERWLVAKEVSSGSEVQFDGAAGPMLAFGQGPRGCYGKKLAYLQLRIVLCLVVYNFRLLPCAPHLSGYKARLVGVVKPEQCYVALREIETNALNMPKV
ncbi:cytochrome P450 monooxygenase [Astrocystis sublimbata]|nr:cytochrome P450 monooxygenase [Astrocystis sublimbata]